MFIFDAALIFYPGDENNEKCTFFYQVSADFESGNNFLSFLLCFNIIMSGFVKSH